VTVINGLPGATTDNSGTRQSDLRSRQHPLYIQRFALAAYWRTPLFTFCYPLAYLGTGFSPRPLFQFDKGKFFY
jgi:hypothetical protein